MKVEEKDDKVVFGQVANKGELYVLGVNDASYSKEDLSVDRDMIMIGQGIK